MNAQLFLYIVWGLVAAVLLGWSFIAYLDRDTSAATPMSILLVFLILSLVVALEQTGKEARESNRQALDSALITLRAQALAQHNH